MTYFKANNIELEQHVFENLVDGGKVTAIAKFVKEAVMHLMWNSNPSNNLKLDTTMNAFVFIAYGYDANGRLVSRSSLKVGKGLQDTKDKRDEWFKGMPEKFQKCLVLPLETSDWKRICNIINN